MRRPIRIALATLASLAVIATPAAFAQQSLPLNQITNGSASDSNPAVFDFNAESAGVLTVIVRGENVDIRLMVTDAVGQALPDGETDSDIGGDVGAEQLAVVVPAAGDYQVRVTTWSGSGIFNIAAGWIPYAELGGPADPDALPTAAAVLVPGTPIEDSIDPANGDNWDWFKVTADAAGAITVITDAPSGDIALEVFAEGNWAEPLNRSDQDMQGVAGNESLTVQATAGQTFYFKVSPVFGGDQVSYRIRAGVMSP